VEALLVSLDGEGVMRLPVLDEEAGGLALGVQGIGGDDDTGQVVGLQQGGEVSDFVCLVRHAQLRHGHPGAGHRGE
jgi:hypothetical protein